MRLKPEPAEIVRRLRLDGDWQAQAEDLIEQCHAEMLSFIDRPVFESDGDAEASGDPAAIVSNEALINGQILLIGAYLNGLGTNEAGRMRNTAYSVWRPYRRSGA